MATTSGTAVRGTIMLVASRGCYFVLGYVAVVILARLLGPAAYGAYGVIMSVLAWLEQSGRTAVPAAATKLLAETVENWEELAKTAFALNLIFYGGVFVLLWVTAPWLAAGFGIADGATLIRVAAIDLPFFGLYTALQAIHQGHRRFGQLGGSEVAYAVAKVAGVLALMVLGVSVKTALLLNAFSSLVGAAVLCRATGLMAPARWLAHVRPLVTLGVPMGLYSLAVLFLSSLDLWMLQILFPIDKAAEVGVFVAALNIARVPGFALAAVAQVLLPSVSRAVALDNNALVKQYFN